MQSQITFRDPNLRRFVYDFDALADVLHTLVDHDQAGNRHPDDAPQETEFTTEWQMVATAEDVHPS